MSNKVLEEHLNCRLDDPNIHLFVDDKFYGYKCDTLFEADVLFYLTMTPNQKAVDKVITEINRLGYKIVYKVISNDKVVFIRINRSHSDDKRPSITKHYLKRKWWMFWM